MVAQHGAHASTITVAGREFRIRRDFGLVCRVEERFGALREFAERLEDARFTVRELFDLYKLLLADCENAPTDDEIQGHVIDIGVVYAVAELHPISTAFFFGEERFMQRVGAQEELERLARERANVGNGVSPLRAAG
jgi:hypothetical protein